VKRYLPHLAPLGLYLFLTLALTWPLATHLATHLPGSAVWAFDESTFTWNMWWFKFSVLNLQQTPLHTNYIFYPLGIDLVLYTFNFFNAMVGLPLQMAFSLPLASNLVILAAYVLSGYGGYLLVNYVLAGRGSPHLPDCRPEGGSSGEERVLPIRIAAFVAGAVYAFAASRMIYAALGHDDMVTAQWFPFYALFFLKTLREPGYKNAVLAGLCATFALLAEMIFGVFLLFLSVILILAELPHAPSPSPQSGEGVQGVRSVLVRLLVLTLTVAVLWSPVMLPILNAFAQGGFALTGWGEGVKLSADLVGWFTPTALHPLFGAADWPAYLRSVVEGHAPTLDVNTVFLGYGVLALALLGAVVAWKRARVWAYGAVLFAVFTLGPLLQIHGRYLFPFDNLLREQGLSQDVTFPLPFALLHYLPIIKANRVPNRFSVVLSLALAVLVGYGAAYLLRKIAARFATPDRKPEGGASGASARCALIAAGAVILAAVLFDQVSVPLPLTDARVPAVYAEIGSEPGDFAILQLPLGWRNSFGTLGAERTQLQIYQATHGKHMLAGNISRAPAFKFDYFDRIPLFHALTETEMYRAPDDETLARARAQAGELLALYDLRYLVIHDSIPLRYPYADTMPATRDLALSLLPHDPESVASADGATAYRLIQPALPDPLRVDFGDWRSAPYRGEGWGDDELVFGATANWAIGSQARIFFPVRSTPPPGPPASGGVDTGYEDAEPDALSDPLVDGGVETGYGDGEPDALSDPPVHGGVGGGLRRLKLAITPFDYPGAPPQTMTLALNDRPLNLRVDLQEGWQIVGVTLPGEMLRSGLNTLTLHFEHAASPSSVLGVPDDRPLAAAVDWVEVSGGE
jgi:hypothetical protein